MSSSPPARASVWLRRAVAWRLTQVGERILQLIHKSDEIRVHVGQSSAGSSCGSWRSSGSLWRERERQARGVSGAKNASPRPTRDERLPPLPHSPHSESSAHAHSSARHGDALHGCPESTRKPCRPLTSPLRKKATTCSALRRRPPQSFTPSQSSPRRTMGKDRSIHQAQTTRPIASWERRMSVLAVRLRPKATSSLVVGKYVCSAFSTYGLR